MDQPTDPLARLRTGIATDVHAFAPPGTDRPMWLGCLEWPGVVGLAGHSDGDVAAHAACEALLQAAGLGDVGAVFGIDDPRWHGASGAAMLQHTAALLAAAGAVAGNVAVQVIGQRPRLAPRRSEAEAAMSAALGVPVLLTATTSDGLGFTGRGEGLAAVASALVQLGAAVS